MIYILRDPLSIEALNERGIDVVDLTDFNPTDWKMEHDLKQWFKSVRREFSITYVNDVALSLPRDLLPHWIEGKKYVHLNKHYKKVECWAIKRGYCPYNSINQKH